MEQKKNMLQKVQVEVSIPVRDGISQLQNYRKTKAILIGQKIK